MADRRRIVLAGMAATLIDAAWLRAGETAISVGVGDGADILSVDTELQTGDAQRPLPVRIIAPRQDGSLPILAFSHGAYSSGRQYDRILRAWAAAGFVVLAPTHRDSVSLGVVRGSHNSRYFAWRLDDMALLFASFDEIGRRVPDLRRRMDRQRIAATGHSFGGLVAQTISGATFSDAEATSTRHGALRGIQATVIFSGAGRMEALVGDADLAALRTPLLVTVGSEDLRQVPGLTGYQWRREPFDLAGSHDRYLLTLQGSDHYLGGLVGRDDLPIAAAAQSWLATFNRVTLWFLARYLLGRSQPLPEVAPNLLESRLGN